MAATRLDRVGDGSTTVYSVTFSLGYMRKEFVYVYLASQQYTEQLGYTWLNSTQIELDEPLPTGTKFHIRRVVVRDKPVNDYESGAILRENNLDDSFLQHLMIQEEIADGYFTLVGDLTIQSKLDMRGNKIVNVGNAVDQADALPLGQADARFVNITGDTVNGPLAIEEQLDMLGNRVVNVGDAVSAEDALTLGQADVRYINTTGDAMTGPLSGIPATADAHFTTLLQLANIVDARITAVTITNPEFVDFGLITEIVTDTDDYGSI